LEFGEDIKSLKKKKVDILAEILKSHLKRRQQRMIRAETTTTTTTTNNLVG